jgi:hypothetical protein
MSQQARVVAELLLVLLAVRLSKFSKKCDRLI